MLFWLFWLPWFFCSVADVDRDAEDFRDDFLTPPVSDFVGQALCFGVGAPVDWLEPASVPAELLDPLVWAAPDVEASPDDELPTSVPDVEGADVADEVFESVDELAADDEPDDELDVLDELESAGFASAIPGVVATAVPTPSATASAPTRPT